MSEHLLDRLIVELQLPLADQVRHLLKWPGFGVASHIESPGPRNNHKLERRARFVLDLIGAERQRAKPGIRSC